MLFGRDVPRYFQFYHVNLLSAGTKQNLCALGIDFNENVSSVGSLDLWVYVN